MKLDEKNQYEERLQRFKKAFLLEKPDRIPVEIIFDATFCIQYAGCSLTEGTWDITKAGSAIEKCFEGFEFDYCRSFTFRSPCITGFFPQSLLANGTKQQCVDKIKELIDVLAPGGGYMFSADKNLIGLSDVNMENYHAVIDYLYKYGNY